MAINNISKSPVVSAGISQLKSPEPSLLSVKVASSGRFSAVKTGIVPFKSLAVTVNSNMVPDVALRFPIGSITGATSPRSDTRTVS